MSSCSQVSPNDAATSTQNENQETIILPSNRFELELEFLQSLSSPAYLHHLATQNFFQDPAFLSFLRYLQYWKEPKYIRFITYPHCLYFLDLLCENETFRREMGNVAFRDFVHSQQFLAWQHRSRNLYGSGLVKVDKENNEETVKDDQEEEEGK